MSRLGPSAMFLWVGTLRGEVLFADDCLEEDMRSWQDFVECATRTVIVIDRRSLSGKTAKEVRRTSNSKTSWVLPPTLRTPPSHVGQTWGRAYSQLPSRKRWQVRRGLRL